MQNDSTIYDVAIIGGGLAGLALGIQLARNGYGVVLLEKEKYPFHKVCGEYISNESKPFLESLGIPLAQMSLPQIDTLHLTAPDGKLFRTRLPLGGFGIRRYTLDYLLAEKARQSGVTLLEETKATEIITGGGGADIKYTGKNGNQHLRASVGCAAYGKRSNLDVKGKRSFLQAHHPKLENHVAVKYHVQTDWPRNVIGLHNFRGGYCGISKIDGERYCLCYLTTAEKLNECGNVIPQLEEGLLHQNPALKKIFSQSQIDVSFPITISQISFAQKTQIENGLLMLGDAAGMITPLCGNGMSMALHSSKLAAAAIQSFLQKKMNRRQMEEAYQQAWRKQFAGRLRTGRLLQQFFGSPRASQLFVKMFRTLPFLASPVIRQTHGRLF